MKFGRNLLASISYSGWSAIASLIAVPLLIKYLGAESYGLVGLYASAQGVLFVLDMGLAPAVNREVARNKANDVTLESAHILRTLAPIYAATALLIAVGFYLAAPAIAGNWLNVEQLPLESVVHSLTLLGLIIACRWPAALFQNALMGAGKLTVTSGIGIITVTLANGGGALVVALVSATPEAFFQWQLVCAVLHTMLMYLFAWRIIGHREKAQWDFGVLRRIWKFSAGMTGVSITAIIFMQLDKILLSRLVPLEELGHYALASLLASGLYVLLTPTFNTIYPRFSSLIAAQRTAELQRVYRTGTRFLACVIFPAALGGALFSYEVLAAWTSDPELAVATAPVFALLLLGTAFNGAMHFPYALQLASGASWIPLVINLCLVTIFIPLLITLTTRMGVLGGGAAWLSLNAIYLVAGGLFTHRVLLPGTGVRWLLVDVLTPFALTLVLLYLGSTLIHRADLTPWSGLLMGVSLSLLVVALNCTILLPQQTRLAVTWSARKLRSTQSS